MARGSGLNPVDDARDGRDPVSSGLEHVPWTASPSGSHDSPPELRPLVPKATQRLTWLRDDTPPDVQGWLSLDQPLEDLLCRDSCA